MDIERKQSHPMFLKLVFVNSPPSGTRSGNSCTSVRRRPALRGIEPQQHQVLLALKGLPKGIRPTTAALSRQLCLRHHSTVELINRLVDHGAVRRRKGEQDHREVLIELTPHGEELLQRLVVVHREELRVSGPALCESLQAVVRHGSRGRLE